MQVYEALTMLVEIYI